MSVVEKNETEKDKEETSFVIKLFGDSSIIGLPQIFTTRSIVRKLVWSAVLITGLTFCIMESYQFMAEFRKYPVIVNVEMDNKGELPFPAVTICNMNSVVRSKSGEMPVGNTPPPILRLDTFVAQRKEIAKCKEKDEIIDEFLSASFFNQYYRMNKTSRGSVGHQITDLVNTAKFSTEKLDPEEDFMQIVKPKYGACYTFNDQTTGSNKSVYVSRTIGTLGGLTLRLNLEVEKYVSLTPSVGAVVIIHPSKEFPDTDGSGINIMPGVETSIAITKQSFTRLPAPYKDKCKDYKAETEKKIKPKILNQHDCFIYCLQRFNNKECECTDPTLIFTNGTEKCDLENNDQVCCLERVFEEFISCSYERCDCPLECRTTKYPAVISSALWPAPKHFKKENPSGEYSAYRAGYAKVNIYYSSLEETNFVQRPAYQDSEWYSHLGGQLGLWLGISIPAMFDCLETILILFYHGVSRLNSKTAAKHEVKSFD